MYSFCCSLFHAAKCIDNATLICKEINEPMEIARLAEQACHLYQTNGNPEAGALCLDKAAKMIEMDYPERAIDLYRRGVDVVMVCTTIHIPCKWSYCVFLHYL